MVLLVLFAWHSVLEIWPQIGVFFFSACRLRLRIPGVEKAMRHVPAWVQPWVRQQYGAPQPLVDRKNASVVLFGAMHKTGSEMAKRLVSVICGRLTLCCYIATSGFSSVDELNRVLGSETEPRDLFFSNHFEWLPAHIHAPYSHLVFFYRKPLRVALSAFEYHGRGEEGGYRFPESACATNGLPPASAEVARRFCSSWDYRGREACADAHGLSTRHSGGAPHADSTAAPGLATHPGWRPLPPAVYAFACEAVRPWIGYDMKDAWPNRSSHASAFAAAAATFFFQSFQMARIMNESVARAPETHLASRSGGGSGGSSLERDGRRALLVDLEEMMASYDEHVATMLDFVAAGLPRVPPSATRGLAGAMRAYDVKHSHSVATLYQTLMSGHVSSLDAPAKEAMLADLAGRPLTQQAYRPMLELMGARGRLK